MTLTIEHFSGERLSESKTLTDFSKQSGRKSPSVVPDKNLMNIYINIHKMKINYTYMFLVFVLILLIVISMSRSCVHFKPYSENTIFSKQFPYEAMTNNTPSSSETYKPTELDVAPSQFVPPILPINKNSSSPSSSNTVTAESMTNMSSSPYNNTESVVSVFSGTVGSLDCGSKSSNLTNSMGGLCLSEEQQRLLKTRGGNATGGDSQIGK